jgi:hypothetical protein
VLDVKRGRTQIRSLGGLRLVHTNVYPGAGVGSKSRMRLRRG